MTARVFVLGSLHLDVIVTAPRLPRTDETLMGDAVRYEFGGKGGNQALAAARMGVPVSMAGRVGDDAFADQIKDRLQASGVDHAQVLRKPGATGMSVAIVDRKGDYGAIVVSGVNRTILSGDVAMPGDTRILCLQNEIPEERNLTLARAARARGITVMLNAAPARPTSPDLLALVDVLIVNRVEGHDISGKSDPQDILPALASLGPDCVILTLGADGAMLRTPDTPARHFPACPVDVISSHGAGDAFAGTLAAELARGSTVRAALAFAQAAAALHVSTPIEDRASITRDTVTRFLTP
jgi:ribokinase